MGYLTDFRSTLEAKLSALPDVERKEVIDYVANEVLTSYRNGLRDAKSRPAAKRGRSSARGAKRRNYQQK